MKKKYQKPQMVVENFIVSDYIATCTDILTFADNAQCTDNRVSATVQEIIGNFVYDGGFVNEGTCDYAVSLDMVPGITCYHNPTGGTVLFSS